MEFERFKDLPDAHEEDEALASRPVLQDSKNSSIKYTVPPYPMFIGREKNIAVCIPVPAVSRKHARVFERDGKFYIQDLGSINGTFLNGQRVIDPVELKVGDRIMISVTKKFPGGVREFVFKYDDEEQKAAAEIQELRKSILPVRSLDIERKKLAIKHCKFYVLKKDLMSVIRTEIKRRVFLTSLQIDPKTVQFMSLWEYKPKDTIVLTIEHRRFSKPFEITLRIDAISPVVDVPEIAPSKVFQHDASIIKFTDQQREEFQNAIHQSAFICYFTSRIKE